MTARILLISFTATLLLLQMPTQSEARSFRIDQVPNASSFGCGLCHQGGTAGAPRTLFGLQVEESLVGTDVDWGAIFDLDADGDGFTNGEELGDPDGDGLFIEGFMLTSPNDPDDMPECITDAQCSGEGSSTGRRFCAPTGVCIESGGDFECSADDDCDEAHVCESGQCVRISECAGNPDCEPNIICLDGACVDPYELIPCTNIVCGPGQTCVDDVCVEATSEDVAPGSVEAIEGGPIAPSSTDTTDPSNDEEALGCQLSPQDTQAPGELLVFVLLAMALFWRSDMRLKGSRGDK